MLKHAVCNNNKALLNPKDNFWLSMDLYDRIL